MMNSSFCTTIATNAPGGHTACMLALLLLKWTRLNL
jgi:hypothetical protein